MVVRSGVAVCGAMIMLVVSSAAMARSRVHDVHAPAGVASSGTIVGAASTYNPFHPGWREGGPQTASGERYDPSAWAAAIRTDLRGAFGGVRQGSKPRYALVEAKSKKVVVKINDVGPLTPGRVVDFNERTMRYFDPSLRAGVISGVKVTPLRGDGWTPGPLAQG